MSNSVSDPLRHFVNDSPRAKAMFDVEMRYVAASQRWCATYDVERTAIIGRSCYEVSPLLAEAWRTVHTHCLAGGIESGEREIRLPATGALLWVRWEARSWRTAGGAVGGVLVRMEDITAERSAQLAISKRERLLRIALDASQAGTWSLDIRTRRVVMDRRSSAIFGLSEDADTTIEEMMGLIAPDDRERMTAMKDGVIQSAADHEWAEDFRIVRPDGAARWIHSRGRTQRDSSGQLVGMAGINLDVTERKDAEEVAHKVERQARLALDASGAFAWHWNPNDGPWVLDSDAASRLGVQPGAFRTDEYLARVHPDDRAAVEAAMAAVRTNHGPPEWDTTYRLTTSTGRVVCFHSRGTIQRDSNGRACEIYGITIDVTARRNAEIELERSHAALRAHTWELERRSTQLQQLASALMLAEQRTRERLSQLLHDHLQQLLFSALLNVGRASKEAPTLGLLRQVHGQLTDAIEETRSLSADLVPSMLRQGDLPGALTWLGTWMDEKYGLAVGVSVDAQANPPNDDVKFLLFESARELLFNVVKHSSASAATLTMVKDDRDRFLIVVTDAGVGFDPNTLSSRPGADDGLGLFGMRERLALFGGQLHVWSAPGQGARFTLVVPHESPWAPRQTTPMRDQVSVSPAPDIGIDGPRPLRILIADDHAIVRDAVRRVLMEHPALLVVGDAADGVEAVRQARLLAPDAVIMDVSMPRMDGIEAIRRIRAAFPTAWIAGLSSEAVTTQPHPTAVAGADDYYSKGDLSRLVERLLVLHAERCGT